MSWGTLSKQNSVAGGVVPANQSFASYRPAQAVRLLLWLALFLAAAACAPPTPPPSPTPWPSDTPSATPTEQPATPQAQATATATPIPLPTLTPTTTPLPPSPTAIPAITNIMVWVDLPPAQFERLAVDVEAFQDAFPQYTVTLKSYSGPESLMTPLMTGEIRMDVALVAPALLGNLWRSQQIAPMSDFFPAAVIDSFAAKTLAGAAQNGAIWGLPETSGFHLMLFYNKALLDTPPASTAQLEAMVDDASGEQQHIFGLNSYDPLWLLPWLGGYGGQLTDEAGRPSLNTPAMEQALSHYLRWHDAGGIASSGTYDEVLSQFLAGELAMMVNGEWAIAELAANREFAWGLALLPAIGQPDDNQPATPLLLSKYWAISRAATEAQASAAASFVEYITRPERQLAWAARYGQLPTRRSALEDPLIVNDSLRRVSVAQMQAGQTIPLGVNANYLLDAMRQPLAAALAGELTPAEAVEMMQENLAP